MRQEEADGQPLHKVLLAEMSPHILGRKQERVSRRIPQETDERPRVSQKKKKIPGRLSQEKEQRPEVCPRAEVKNEGVSEEIKVINRQNEDKML